MRQFCISAAILTVFTVNSFAAKIPVTTKFDKNKTISVMNRVCERIFEVPMHDKYEIIFANWGLFKYSQFTNNDKLNKKEIENYNEFLKKNLLESGHVDKNACGVLGFEIYMQTKDPNYLEKPLFMADDEWVDPLPDGLTRFTRLWTDDMYMVAAIQIQAYRATGKPEYLDRAITQLLAYAGKIQQQNGLFQHSIEIPVFWGRANGWAFSSLTITLENTPKEHPKYKALMDVYKKMALVLTKYQDADGLWHQVLIDSDSFAETSCTAMFVYGYATGLKNGWLDKSYYKIANKGFNGLLNKIEDGLLLEVCVGTNEGKLYNHYLNRPRKAGDHHGMAPLLWATVVMLQLNN